jgi:serine/threonine-protein kinase
MPAPAQDIVRFTVPLGPDESFPIDTGLPSMLAVSSHGHQILYAARQIGGDRLYLRRPQDSAPVALAGTEGAIGPFFSPDGQWIGFASGGELKKLSPAGGKPQTLAEAPTMVGASWGPDDTIVYGPQWTGTLVSVSARGGDARPLTTLDTQAGELAHTAPHILPGGHAVLMAVTLQDRPFRVDVLEPATGRRRSLVEGRNPFYLSSGHLVFAREDAVFAAPFDVSRLELTGPAVRVLEGVRVDGNDTHFAVGRDGTLAYVPQVSDDRELVWVDRRGRSRPVDDRRGPFSHPRISPDGTRVLFQAAGEFWIHDIVPGTRTRLRARGSRPIWTADGRSIIYQYQGRLYSTPVDDGSEPQLVVSSERGLVFPLAWSRDGRTLVYSNAVPETSRDVWMLIADGRQAPFLATPRDERAAMFSPDGRWVVYAAKDTGREEEVYVQPYPGPGGRVTVSRGGGIEPVWSPTGGEIFYRSLAGRRMLAVEVRTEPTFSVAPPQVLFEGNYPVGSSYWSDYDVTPDGNEFLMVAGPETAPPGLQVVINWLAEVKRRLAAPE